MHPSLPYKPARNEPHSPYDTDIHKRSPAQLTKTGDLAYRRQSVTHTRTWSTTEVQTRTQIRTSRQTQTDRQLAPYIIRKSRPRAIKQYFSRVSNPVHIITTHRLPLPPTSYTMNMHHQCVHELVCPLVCVNRAHTQNNIL